jgi:multicomponent Na+:H+ antiporter subunit D
MRVLLLLTICTPVVGAVLTTFTGQRLRGAIGMGSAVVTSAIAFALVGQIWAGGVALEHAFTVAGLEVAVLADGLAATFVATTAVVGILASAFATMHHRRDPHPGDRAYWSLWLLLWGALHMLFVAGDLFTIYLMLELIAVTGVALVVLGGSARTHVAGTRYFFAEFAASATFLLGIGLIWREAGTVTLAALPQSLTATPLAGAGLALMTAGLLLKVPLVPLHFWLPGAHSLAPSTVSPILSAVVVKTAFVVLIRLWFMTMPDAATPGAAQLLGGLGALAVLWGSVNALRAGPVKLLIAHSTVAQLGFMFLLLPMAHAGAWGAWSGGIVQGVAHALAKAAALMAAAVFVRSAPGDAVADLGGTATRRPLATFAFAIAGLSLVGLPPSGGFVAKWYLLQASFNTGQWWWAVIIVIGSLLTAAYLMRVVKRAFAPADEDAELHVARDGREVIALLLALGALALGFRPTELLELLEIGAPVVAPGGG